MMKKKAKIEKKKGPGLFPVRKEIL